MEVSADQLKRAVEAQHGGKAVLLTKLTVKETVEGKTVWEGSGSEYDADDIAKVIAQRPRPSYEERLAVFRPTGRPEPPRDPFPARGGMK
jgi:hypothetical protein